MPTLTPRTRAILDEIARSYVRAAAPVSSFEIAMRLPYRISSATVRNEMAALEAQGLLEQPHRSAGRVPTTDAFRFIASELLEALEPQLTERVLRGTSVLRDPSIVARRVARTVEAAAFVSCGSLSAFAGLEFVLGAPELRSDEARGDFARFLDEAPNFEARFREAMALPLGVFIGEENPIVPSPSFSIVSVKLPRRGVIAILGPIRMDYWKSISALLRCCRDLYAS